MSEEPWTENPLVLIDRILRIWPFQEKNQTKAEKLNARARLTLIVGLSIVYLLFRKGEQGAAYICLMLTLFNVMQQGIDFQKEQHEEKEKKENNVTAQKKEIVIMESPPNTAVEQISQEQSVYAQVKRQMMQEETQFEKSLAKIGGSVSQQQSHQQPLILPAIEPNSGPFQFNTAVRSSQPMSTTHHVNYIERMKRPIDEVDPGLVTNPLPDPTFMARQPIFDHSAENAANERARLQNLGRMRFF